MTTINGFEIWDAEFDKKHFTPEEIAESNFRVSAITKFVRAQNNKNKKSVNKIKLEELSAV